MASMAPSDSCGENRFSVGASYGVLHPVIDIFYMQSLTVSQKANFDTLVCRLGQGGRVALGIIEKCDLQN